METVKRELVYKKMRELGLPVYFIYTKDGKNLLSSQENETANIDSVIETLGEDLQYCDGQYVIVECRKKAEKETGGSIYNRGIYRYNVKLSQDTNSQPGINGFESPNNIYVQLLGRIGSLETALVEKQKDFELASMKQQLEFAQENAKSPMIDKLADAIIGKAMQMQNAKDAVAPMAGVPAHTPVSKETEAKKEEHKKSIEEHEKIVDERTKRNNSLLILKKFDPKLEMLNDIAAFAAKNPEQFKAIVKQIKEQANEQA